MNYELEGEEVRNGRSACSEVSAVKNAHPVTIGCRRHVGKLVTSVVLILIGAASAFLSTVEESEALPAFARKYQADCAMCHYPVIPRLNTFGQQYRRAGYRTPDEFGKTQDFTKVNEMFAGRITTQFRYEDKDNAVSRTEFKFPDVSLFYSGAISRNFSTWIHGFSNNSSNFDLHGHIQGVFGTSDSFFSFRVGQMHMLQQEGAAGFGRSTGLTLPVTQTIPLTNTNTPVLYTFNKRQNGIELAYVRGKGRLLVQITNGLDETGSGTNNTGDIDSDKDYMVAFDYLLDDIASGFTVFYYHGTTHGVVNQNPSAVDREFNYWRTGFNISKVFHIPAFGFLEFQGAYYRSHDNNPSGTAAGTSVDGNAFYIESQQYITGPEITFYERYSWIDLNQSQDNAIRQDVTVGVVTPIQTWLRLTADYTYTKNDIANVKGHLATLELQVNY